MRLFEVAILEKPTKKQGEDGASERLVFGPESVVAADGQSAAIAAVMERSSDISCDRSRMQVLVRPFV